MRKILLAPIVSLSAGNPHSTRRSKPPLNALRITGEVIIGEVFACAGLVGAFFLAHALEGSFTMLPANSDTPIALAFVAIVGCIGVSLVGIVGNETGSYWAALAGGAVGVLVGWLYDVIQPNFDPLKFLPFGLGSLPIMWFFPAIGATVGFNFSRRYK